MAKSKDSTVITATKLQKKTVVGKPFAKGQDARRNLKGRPPVPKDQRELNTLLDELFAEEIANEKGERMQKLRVALNRLLLSKNPSGPIHILDRRFGKVPQPVEGEIKGDVILRVVRESSKQNDA